MPVELQKFAPGDTDYIAKLNGDMVTIESILNQLLGTTSGGATSAASVGDFYGAIFNGQTTIIGPPSYKPTASGVTLTIAPGGAYKVSNGAVVSLASPYDFNFTGLTSGNYYISPGPTGLPVRGIASGLDDLYRVFWSGAAITSIDPVAQIMFNAAEEDAGRKSTILAEDYLSLDDRLEAIEAVTDAARFRTVGSAFSTQTGPVGAVQVPFAGTIIGWSVIASQVGDLSVDVEVVHNSAPPGTPAIPTTGDKISASAPIGFTAARAASAGLTGVSTWTPALAKWDTVLFSVGTNSGFDWVTVTLLVALF